MMYFIESVTTFQSSGKSKKGALLQAAVSNLEHNFFGDDDGLFALRDQLSKLVDLCNKEYKGSKMFLKWHEDACQIEVISDSTSERCPVFRICYAPMKGCIPATIVGLELADSIIDTSYSMYQKFTQTQGDK